MPSDAVNRAAPIRRRLRRKEAFRAALRKLHAIGPGIYELSTPETTVCRCEEVTAHDLNVAVDASADVGVVKGLTRAGMGLCQGRNCQRQVAAAIARRHGTPLASLAFATPRAPIRPVPIAAFADHDLSDGGFFTDR